MSEIQNTKEYAKFFLEIKERIRTAQYEALKKVNQELLNLYWDIGSIIVARQKEHGWGKSIVENLSKDLQNEFVGMLGFSERNLWNMRRFYVAYNENPILQPLVAVLSWTHNILILDRCKDDKEKQYLFRDD